MRYSIGIPVVALFLAAGAGSAAAAIGDLAYGDCHSGETATVACSLVGGATADGDNSGLQFAASVEVSPDGRSLYAAGRGDDAVAHFERSSVTGALDYISCVSGDTLSAGACSQLPGASANGAGSGLDGAQSLALSPDGRSLYVGAGGDDAVAHFQRDPSTGALTFEGCVSGDELAGSCTRIAEATVNGNESGLSNPDSLEVSPDGDSVYAVSSDDAVARFGRDTDGTLAYKGCLGADTLAACNPLPGAVPGGSDTGFSSLRALALSPDGRSLYTVSDSDESVGEFLVSTGGALVFRRCLTGATSIANCVPLPGSTPNGDTTGMRSTVHVAVSPEGNSVYTVADDDNSVVHFERAASGALDFRGCLSGDVNAVACTPVPGAGPGGGSNSGMNAAVWAEVAPDGRSVYVAAVVDSAINRFGRNPRTGVLSWLGCLSVRTETAPCALLPTAVPGGGNTGLAQVRSLAISPGGESLYGSSAPDAAIARFGREPDRAGPRLRVGLRKRQRGGTVVVRATCLDEFCPRLAGRGSFRVPPRLRGKLRSVQKAGRPAGRSTTLKLSLSRRAKKSLKKAGRGSAKVVVVASDLLGNSSRRSARVKLRG